MSISKRIICLANSRRQSGRCLAGKEIVGNKLKGWIRPVSENENEELHTNDMEYDNGKIVDVLDIFDIELKQHVPHKHQRENWLIDPNVYLTFVDKCKYESLSRIKDAPDTLWYLNCNSFAGVNDEVRPFHIKYINQSLYLIKPDSLCITVCESYTRWGSHRKRVQANIEYNGNEYVLWITDPNIESKYKENRKGYTETIPESYLTISLAGNAYRSYYFKLVTAVITPES